MEQSPDPQAEAENPTFVNKMQKQDNDNKEKSRPNKLKITK